MNNLIRQILRFRAAIVFAVLEVLSFSLIFNNTYYPQTQMYNVMQRFQNYLYAMAGQFADYLSLKQENELLAAENAMLRRQLFNYQIADTSSRTKHVQHERYLCYTAKVANATTNKQNNYMTIDIGSNAGIHRDMGVMANGSAAGIVVNTSPNFSTIMPILNRRTKISARHKRSGHIGSLTWDGVYYRTALLVEVPQHASVAEGDTIVTSGYSSIFPEGILIGTIIDYTIQKGSYYQIRVRLAVDFNSIQYVDVIDNRLQLEQQVLELEQDYSGKPN